MDSKVSPDGGDLIPLSEAARISGYSAGHVRYLVTRGLMAGWKIGRHYVTTREAVARYLETKPKRGRKRQSSP